MADVRTMLRDVLLAIALALAFVAVIGAFSKSKARDLGQWEGANHLIKQWYENLMRPDVPGSSCCGEADAYWADSFDVDRASGQYIAIITDERDDAPLKRPHVPPGTRITVPNEKIKWNEGNPTGRGVIFMNGSYVYCYVPPGGV